MRFLFTASLLFMCSAMVLGKAKGGVAPMKVNFTKALTIAISKNHELKAIQARAGIYRYQIEESFREYFPSLSLSYSKTDEVRKRSGDDRQGRLSLSSEVILYDGGRRSLNHDMAKLDAILARNDYRIAMNKLTVQVKNLFLNLLNLKERMAILERTLSAAKLQHSFISKEFELGDSTKLSVLEIAAKVKEVELSLKKSQGDYSSQINKFKLLLKLHRRLPLEIEGQVERDFKIIPFHLINKEELITIALKKRREIESMVLQVERSRRNYEINKNYFMPKLSMGFNYNLSGEEFPPREKGWGINFKISSQFMGSSLSGGSGYNESGNGNSRAFSRNAGINLLNNMSYKRGILESEIDLFVSQNKLKDTKDGISLEVESLYKELINARDMMKIAKQRLELYNSLIEIERAKKNMGESRRYDLVEKEIERSKSALALMDAKIKYLTSISNLEMAMGVNINFLAKYMEEKGEREKATSRK